MSCPKNCGPCFGYFPSEHQDSDNSDDEQEAKDPKFANMVGKKRCRNHPSLSLGTRE